VVGTGTAYARNDHLHGLPANEVDEPPSGTWLSPAGSNTTLATSNRVVGCFLFVPIDIQVQAIGVNITAAGDAASVLYLSLYRKTPRQNLYAQVLGGEQTLNVGAATGVQQQALANPTLVAGRYLALVRAVATTYPTISARSASPGFPLFAFDIAEVTTDPTRGGVGYLSIAGYPAAGGAPASSFSLQPGTRVYQPSIFLQAT
jgi:hypothetical protein